MRAINVLTLLLVSLLTKQALAGNTLLQPAYTLIEPHQPIELQSFIQHEKTAYQGRITLVPPLNIRFTGVLKTLPQKKATGYLYTALQVMQVSPLPVIEYQAFIGAPANGDKAGEVIAVYIDNRLAEALVKLDAKTLLDQRLNWYGYHIYNFSRGPAIVLENVGLENVGLENVEPSAGKVGR